VAAAQTGADALAALLEEARTAVALLGQPRTPTSAAAAQTGADAPVALLEEARTATVADGSMESAAFTGSVTLPPRIGTDRSMEIAAFTGSVALSPRIGTVVTTGSRLLSGTSVPTVGGLPSPRPTTSSGLR